MSQEITPKPRSRTKTILIATGVVVCLALIAGWAAGPTTDQKNRFLAQVRQNALSDCNNDPECLENIRLHFDECLHGNYVSERSGIFTTTYNLDTQGLYDCLNGYQQTP
jgi:hypothetical protein